ncbi:MAG: protease [candidate division KSB1 bacterium]|nr:protease [candidate division KSB1 bacterium]
MSRPLVEIEIEGNKLNAVLDTGSRRSYITKQCANNFPKAPVEPFSVMLGGKTFRFDEVRIVTGFVKDTDGRKYRFTERLFEVEDLGEENGRRIDILFGIIILEDWGTVIDESVIPAQVEYRILKKGELMEL